MPMPEAGSSPLLLDTHVWVWTMEGDRTALSAPAAEEIEAAGRAGRLLISAISVWEVSMLEAKGRISLSIPLDAWVQAALRAPGSRLLDLSPRIAIESARLPADPPGDSADRILMAGARVESARLVTCDRDILEYAGEGHLAVLDARP